MARKTKRDWLMTGLRLMAEGGIEALTIEALTSQLGVTKGSFYHHFGNHRAYLDSLLDFYEREGTLSIIELTEQEAMAGDKLRHLLDIVVRHEPNMDVALRAWAQQDERARAVQARVDGQRIGYVQALWVEMIGDEVEALVRSQMLYAILVGSEQIQPPLGAEVLRQLFDAYLQVYDVD